MDEIITLIEDDEDQSPIEEIKLFPKQTQFVMSSAKYAGYGGGFGNGKTMSGCIKAYRHCMDQPNAFFLIGRRHATDLRDSTRRDFLQLFGEEGTFKEKDNVFIFPNGAEIIFRHLDDMKSLTNMNLSGYWIDQAEEVGEDSFKFLNGRLRRKKGITRREGSITFNMAGHDWIYRVFKKGVDVKGEPIPNWSTNYDLIEASSLENAKNLPKDYIEALMSQDDEYIKRYVYGSWDVFQGQIFGDWNPATHVIAPFVIPNTWPRYRSIDHGQNAPTACVWFATDYDSNVYAYQEYYQPDAPVSTHVKNIRRMSQIQAPSGMVEDNYEYTLIDPSTAQKNREKKMDNGTSIVYSVKDEYYDAGISTTPAQNDRLAGINRVREYLKLDPKRYHPFKVDYEGQPIKGAPKLFVFETCINLIEEIGQYRWKPSRLTGGGEMEDAKPEVLKRNDHATDAVRYFIMSRPQGGDLSKYIDPSIWNHPLELARYAQQQGLTVDDLIVQRYGGQTAIGHSSRGITHSTTGISHQGF